MKSECCPFRVLAHWHPICVQPAVGARQKEMRKLCVIIVRWEKGRAGCLQFNPQERDEKRDHVKITAIEVCKMNSNWRANRRAIHNMNSISDNQRLGQIADINAKSCDSCSSKKQSGSRAVEHNERLSQATSN